MDWHAKKTPNKTALVFEGKQISWQQLNAESDKAAYSIYQKIGDHKRQRVISLLLPNGWQFVVAYLAVLKLGHIAHPLDPAYKKLELDAILDQMPSLLTITDSRYVSLIGHHSQPAVLINDLLGEATKPYPTVKLKPDQQVASLTFTSGTTGKPKAVPYTHANHLWNIEVCSKVWDWTATDTLLIALPLSHFNGIVMGLSGALYHGNTIYLQAWFDETETLAALASGKISFFTHVAPAYIKLVQQAGDYDLSGVRLCVSGGAPLPPAIWHEFKRRFGIEILEAYGSSETGRIAANRLDERVLGSPGQPLPGVSARISQDDELEIQSPGVFPGYYHNETATNRSLSADGYWKTGDVGEIKKGYIYLKGRIQERIRRFGYTISPRDVEWALHQHPKIKDIYVMGHQQAGEPNDELIYFIVGDITEEELAEFCKQNLLFAWRPGRVVYLDDIPRTPSGKPKIDRLKVMAA